MRVWLAIAISALLTACAPTVQRAMAPPGAFAGARFEADAFVSFDGARLGLSTWAPQDGRAPWAVIVAHHGMNDYGEAFYLAGPAWAEAGVATYAYDARGFGRSPQRGVWAGTRLMTQDLRTAVALARRRHPEALIAVAGDSMGAAVAMAAFGGDDPPAADRLILLAPAVWGWSTLPDAYALTLWVGAHTFPWRPVTPPKGVQRKITASDNIDMLRKIGRDRNMLFETRIDAVYGLVSLMEAASTSAARIKVPTAFLYGARDQVVPAPAARAAAQRLGPGAQVAVYPNGYHMLLRDRQASVVWTDVLAFLKDPAAPLPSVAPGFAPEKGAPRKGLTSMR